MDSLACNIIYFLLNLNYHCLRLGDSNFKSLKRSGDGIPNLSPHKKILISAHWSWLKGLTCAFPHIMMPPWNVFPLPPPPSNFPFPNGSHVSHNVVTVSDGLHIQQWTHKIIMKQNFLYKREGCVVQKNFVFSDGSKTINFVYMRGLAIDSVSLTVSRFWVHTLHPSQSTTDLSQHTGAVSPVLCI